MKIVMIVLIGAILYVIGMLRYLNKKEKNDSL